MVITNFSILGFAATALWAPLLINWLYRLNIVMKTRLLSNKANEEYIKIHGHKVGTPDMGGLMISVTAMVLALLFIPRTPIRDVFLLGVSLFTTYGFIEGMMVKARKLDEKFKQFQETFVWRLGKLFVLYLVCAISIYVATVNLNIQSFALLPGWQIPMNLLTLLLLSFIVVLAIYGVEITDGADGLVTGQFLILTVAMLVVVSTLGKLDLMPYLGVLLGSLFVYLYFNINPARVFMGAVGTMPVAFTFILFALFTNTLWVFLIMGIVFWVELFSSAIQILSLRFWGKKVFRIAPIHHHFEAIGWPETKVVQRFWLACAVAALVGLWCLAQFG